MQRLASRSHAGRLYIVTGGSTPLGGEIVQLLFEAGARVLVPDKWSHACISVASSRKAASKGPAAGSVEFVHMDAASIASICCFLDGCAHEQVDAIVHAADFRAMVRAMFKIVADQNLILTTS